jgi:CMP/dCMP kinase
VLSCGGESKLQNRSLPNVITIDGPAASGKSTVGLMLAGCLGYLFLDTGIMYRALTLAAIRNDIDASDEKKLTDLARSIDLDIVPLASETDGRHYTVLLDKEDVTWDIRQPAVDGMVSRVSMIKDVRAEMVRRQQAFARRGRVVMVGRDIGTVVVPDAPLKLFVTASPEERAGRRLYDRQRQGEEAEFNAILADVIRRDNIDRNREHSPLRSAEDAINIDTTGRTPEAVIQEILNLITLTNEPS